MVDDIPRSAARLIQRAVAPRVADASTSCLLLGARQVGKSTLCRSLHPKLNINLADESTFLAYAKDPALVRREVLALPEEKEKTLVLIDEVQRIPSLLNTIQSLIDENPRRFRFLLTGSSARKLRRGGANLLPGRIVLQYADPLLWYEMGERFSLDRALRVGCLPGVYLQRPDTDEGEAILATYAEVYLREEIRAEALTREVGAYGRFLDVAAVMSGQFINYSKLSSDTEIPKETVRRFFDILEDTLVGVRLPAFSPAVKRSRRVTQRSKILIFDIGVRNALLGTHQRPVPADALGDIFEQWFILQVFYLHRALAKAWRLSAYRSQAGAEVDLVIEADDKVFGIEIKSGRNVGPSDTSGLRSLAELVGPKRKYIPWVVYRGDRRQQFDAGPQAIPFLEALETLREM